VEELTDDKSLPKRERKGLQIEHAPHLSIHAKQIKIADKVCNLGDITLSQPVNWPLQRKREYLEFAERVVAGCRGCSPQLERHFEAVVKEKKKDSSDKSPKRARLRLGSGFCQFSSIC
jgi:hypothetical protein